MKHEMETSRRTPPGATRPTTGAVKLFHALILFPLAALPQRRNIVDSWKTNPDLRRDHIMFNGISVFTALILCTSPVLSAPQLGSKPAKEWIKSMERPERLAKLKADEVMALLELKPGDVVADIGAGSGVFTWPLAQAVAPTGTVYAVEVDQGFLDFIREGAQKRSVENIVPVLGEFTDPKLPVQNLDLAFFHNVLHHIEGRQAYLETLAGYMQPKSRIVIIDLIEGHKEPEMQMNLDQVKDWMGTIGFRLTAEYSLFEDRFFAVFSRKPAS